MAFKSAYEKEGYINTTISPNFFSTPENQEAAEVMTLNAIAAIRDPVKRAEAAASLRQAGARVAEPELIVPLTLAEKKTMLHEELIAGNISKEAYEASLCKLIVGS